VKCRRLQTLALALFLAALPTAAQHVYRTNFPATENPISQSGNWRNGTINGASGNVRTQALVPNPTQGPSTPGWAYGTTNTFSCPPTGCNDSLAVVNTIAWGAQQMACATVHLNTAGFNRNAHLYESEIRLNTTLAAGTNTGYEFQFSTHDGSASPYVGIVRLNGPADSFTQLNSLVPTTVMTEGQLFCATRTTGGHLQAYIDGVPQFTGGNAVTDNTYSGGSPGVGFFNGGGSIADNVNFGWEDFAARDTFSLLADCNETTLNTAVAAATDGLTLVMPNGNCTYAGPSFTTTKQIAIVGLSRMGVNTVLTDNYASATDHLMNLTTGGSFNTELGYVSLFQASTCVGGTCSGYYQIGGTGLPFAIHDVTSDERNFAASSSTTVWGANSVGGVFWNMRFQCEDYTASRGGCDGGSLSVLPRTNWDTPSTMGILDTGESTNIYVEDSTCFNTGQWPDVGDGGRFVGRYLNNIDCSGLTHGTSGASGGRHVEFYHVNYQYINCPGGGPCGCLGSSGQNQRLLDNWFWFRAGTGAFSTNHYDLIASGSCSGTSAPFALTAENITSTLGGRECAIAWQAWHAPGTGSDGQVHSPMNTPSTANPSTGALQPSIGTDNMQISDPIYFWNSNGAGNTNASPGRDTVPNVCDTAAIDSMYGGPFVTASLVHQNRDWFFEVGQKPGYVPAAYPHPVRNTFTLTAAPVVSLSPASVPFGNVIVGGPFPSTPITLTNAGSAPLTFTGGNAGISITGANPADFSQTNNCGTGVLAGGSCTITVKCVPLSAASFSASVSVADNAAGSPQTVPLTCTGTTATAAIGFSPSSVAFAAQTVGTSSSPTGILVTNTGGGTLNISNVQISGGNVTSFLQNNNCVGVPIAPAGTCTINATFSPKAAGALSSAILVTDNAAGSPQSVPLTGTGNGTAGITFTPTSLGFGNQTVGSPTSPLSVTVKNSGTAALTISAVAVGGTNTGDFSPITSNTCITTLAVNATCTVSITFTPGATGARSANLNFTDTAPASPQAVGLTGTGTQAGAGFSPTSLAFGNQNVSTTSAPLTVTLTNTGSATLNITNIATSGTNASDFSIASLTCGATLAPAGTCTVNVTFRPAASGVRSANLLFTDNAPASPQAVPLSGTGTDVGISIAPSSLSFPATALGQSSTTQTITVTNTGGTTITFSGVSLGGANPGDFTIANSCFSLVTLSSQCTVTVTFKPVGTGARSAAVVFTDNAPGSPQSVTVTGTGTQAGAQVPASQAFPNTPVGTTSSPFGLNLHNNGTATLHVSSITIGGADPSYFAISSSGCGTPPFTLAAGATCGINVTFTPQTAIAASGSIVWTDDGPGSPQITTLSGTGTSVSVNFNPASVTFTNQAVSTTSPATPVVMLNTGNGADAITSIVITGANASNFSQTNNCGASLSGGGSCTIQVKFTPSTTGLRSAAITITDGAPGSPHTVSLQGTGFTPSPLVSLSRTTINFGDQTVGAQSNVQVVMLQNVGTASLTITSGTISSGNTGDFGVATTCVSPLAIGAACSYSFTFTPTLAGARAATFSLVTNAASSPDTVALSGNGVTGPPVTPAPQMPFGVNTGGPDDAPILYGTRGKRGFDVLRQTVRQAGAAHLGRWQGALLLPALYGSRDRHFRVARGDFRAGAATSDRGIRPANPQHRRKPSPPRCHDGICAAHESRLENTRHGVRRGSAGGHDAGRGDTRARTGTAGGAAARGT
jgi:hypothetical protein